VALPDFLLIGAPKAGTTALHVALARHPQLCLSTPKEPKHFLVDGPPPTGGGPGDAKTYAEYVWRRSDYEQLWDHATDGQLKGESTTLYLQDPAAHRRIRAAVPDARLVAVLRDPVDRAHSNWSHLRSAGIEPVGDFPRACMLGAERVAQGWGPFWNYLAIGRYGEQLQHLLSVFPPEQVLVLVYRDLRERPRETLDQVCAFLGVDTGVVTSVPAENVTAHTGDGLVERGLHQVMQKVDAITGARGADTHHRVGALVSRLLQRKQQTRPALTAWERELLLPHFLADIDLLESVTGQSFAHWRDSRNGTQRSALDISRRFGTGYSSIDRPLEV
jgi:hypothetical protein